MLAKPSPQWAELQPQPLGPGFEGSKMLHNCTMHRSKWSPWFADGAQEHLGEIPDFYRSVVCSGYQENPEASTDPTQHKRKAATIRQVPGSQDPSCFQAPSSHRWSSAPHAVG